MASKIARSETRTDASVVVMNVLEELLGKNHEALRKRSSVAANDAANKVRDLEPWSSQGLKEHLIEITGQKNLSVNMLKKLSNGYEANVSFPCKSVEAMERWVTSFELNSSILLRPKIVERVSTASKTNVYRAKRRCAGNNVVRTETNEESRCPEVEPCYAAVTMCLKKDGFAHITLFMQHNHSLQDDEVWWSKPQMTEDQKAYIRDLFRAGLTPVQVASHLKTVPVQPNKFPVNATADGSRHSDSQGFSWPYDLRNIDYNKVYHSFGVFKENCAKADQARNVVEMRQRLEHELELFKRRLLRSELLMSSAQCFFNKMRLLSDKELANHLLPKPSIKEQASNNCAFCGEMPDRNSMSGSVFSSHQSASSGFAVAAEHENDCFSEMSPPRLNRTTFNDLITFVPQETTRKTRGSRGKEKVAKIDRQPVDLSCFESPFKDFSFGATQPVPFSASEDICCLKDVFTPPNSPVRIVDEDDDVGNMEMESAAKKSKTEEAQKAFMDTLLMHSSSKRSTPNRRKHFITPTKAPSKMSSFSTPHLRPRPSSCNYSGCLDQNTPALSLEELLRTPPAPANGKFCITPSIGEQFPPLDEANILSLYSSEEDEVILLKSPNSIYNPGHVVSGNKSLGVSPNLQPDASPTAQFLSQITPS